MVTDPTRVTSTSVTLIDHIYTTFPDYVIDVQVPYYAPSDHYPICCTINKFNKTSPKENKHLEIQYRNFKKFSEVDFIKDLTSQPFDVIFEIEDPNEALDLWYDLIKTVLNKHAPIVKKRIKRKYQPKWYNENVRESRINRDHFKKINNHDKYKQHRNMTSSYIRSSKREYFTNAIESDRSCKELWKHLKDLNSTTKQNITCLKKDNTHLTDIKDIVNHLNDHFSTIGSKLIQSPKQEFESEKITSFVNDKISENVFFSLYSVTVSDVFKELENLDSSKSTGLDELGPRILKLSAPIIADSLTHIINLSLCTCNFPKILKDARVAALYKGGDDTDVNNYRPISILPTVSKIFEKIVYKQLYSYLVRHKLLLKQQSGFRAGHSCNTALIKLIDDWLSEMDKGNFSCALFLDFRKAFDIVNHEILLSKLRLYRCDDHSINFFRSYLSDRSQKVKIGQDTSDFQPIYSGVPQGSILGPLLFVIFINDLPLVLENVNADLYADDTTIHKSASSVDVLSTALNADFQNITEWCIENNMVLNTDKTKVMLIGSNRRHMVNESDVKIRVDENTFITSVENQKLLGVHIDKTLSWEAHIDKLCSIIVSRLSLLSRIKLYLSSDCLKLYYNSYILSIMDYCCSVWGNATKTQIDKIYKLQKRAARIILNVTTETPSSVMFKKLEWLTIYNRIEYFKAIMMFKCMNDLAPEYLLELFQKSSSINTYSLRSSTCNNIHVQRARTNFGQRTFQYSGIMLWNSLPQDLKSCNNIISFKKKCAAYLLNKQETEFL